MNKRKDQIARVDRQVLPKDELYAATLEGSVVMKTKWCKYHKRFEPVGWFYVESSSKRKHKYQLRNMCVIGWDITKGKKFIDTDKSTASLLSFFI
jgi:hypothetical protein